MWIMERFITTIVITKYLAGLLPVVVRVRVCYARATILSFFHAMYGENDCFEIICPWVGYGCAVRDRPDCSAGGQYM